MPPTLEQIAAYAYLVENDEQVRNSLLQACFERYPQWQIDYDCEPKYMPDVTEPLQFKSLISLWKVDILSEAREEFAYVYFSLQPQWDIEHGMAAVLHKGRVVAVGDHDSMCGVAARNAT